MATPVQDITYIPSCNNRKAIAPMETKSILIIIERPNASAGGNPHERGSRKISSRRRMEGDVNNSASERGVSRPTS